MVDAAFGRKVISGEEKLGKGNQEDWLDGIWWSARQELFVCSQAISIGDREI